MALGSLDWIIIGAYFVVTLLVGLVAARSAGKNSEQFFLSGRGMPWWLLGFSMVATTFSTDTPNLVTDIVRTGGVAGNWVWWAFLFTGMLTVFVYAKLWRRSGVMTDVEFYELRYSGPEAAFLRGFRALYLGVFFNIVIMASVTLAAIKIGGVLLGLEPWKTVLLAATVTVIFSAVGGFRAVLFTDFLLFCIAMIGSVCAAYVSLGHPKVNGLSGLLSHSEITPKLSFIPDFSDHNALITVMLIPLLVQWWSSWYPGAEPGGGGYVAQRMLAAKNEKHAIGATLFFNCAHYALRPWPWIIVALCSLIVFPDLESIRTAFPKANPSIIGHDIAYPAMLTFLPAGLLGLVVASLAAAYMSTISTHLNWGSSYVVNDFWKRFVNPDASEQSLVTVGRVSTCVMMVIAASLALIPDQSALDFFKYMLSVGAGTGLLFILRWFWWRINAAGEITAMIVSFLVSTSIVVYNRTSGAPLADWMGYLAVVAITTFAWIVATIVTRPTDPARLRKFYRLTTPGGPGWAKVVEEARADNDPIDTPGASWDVPMGILCMVLGCCAVYGALFATGAWIYGKVLLGAVLTAVAAGAAILLFSVWGRLRTKELV